MRFDALVIPGGIGGTQAMRQDESVKQAVREFLEAGKIVASLCAGPTVLHEAGVLAGKTYTSNPGSREELSAGTWVDQPVVRDGNILTSQAPGTAFAFAFALVEALVSSDIAQKVASGMLYRG
jgi:putative intracellular protease/amidase